MSTAEQPVDPRECRVLRMALSPLPISPVTERLKSDAFFLWLYGINLVGQLLEGELWPLPGSRSSALRHNLCRVICNSHIKEPDKTEMQYHDE
nr:hypothetical protein Iba_chr15eCG4760 [Ipomoea batatas]